MCSFTYDESKDLSPVLCEPVMSISKVLETGQIPSSITPDDDFLDESVVSTDTIFGRVTDPFDALEVNKALERYAFDENTKHLSKKAQYERSKAIREAVEQAKVNPSPEGQ